MAQCTHPTCHSNDELPTSDDSLIFEWMDVDGTWVVTCEDHVDESNPTIPVTDETRQISMETLTMLKEELWD